MVHTCCRNKLGGNTAKGALINYRNNVKTSCTVLLQTEWMPTLSVERGYW